MSSGRKKNQEDNPKKTEQKGHSGWLSEPWHKSRLGLGIISADVLLTLILAFVTTRRWENGFNGIEELPFGVIPIEIYLFSLLGALGYVFTALTVDFHRGAEEVLQYNFRLPAALVLGAGIFLFSDIIVGDTSEVEPLILGVVFLSGLYVNLAYKRLGALADRFLPDENNEINSDQLLENQGEIKEGGGTDSEILK